MSNEELKTIQEKYPSYKDYGDGLQILACQIKIWKCEDKKKPLAPPPANCLTLYEVESVEITESYKKVLGSAIVKFPKGTVVKRTITSENEHQVINNTKVLAGMSNKDFGVVSEVREDTRLADVSDFQVGYRIQIKLGYISDPDDFKNKKKYDSWLTNMFEGYIVKCSIATPIEIKCENLASGLKKISCPNKIIKNATVNELFADGKKGKYHLLDGTGLKLHPLTEECDIHVGDVPLTSDLTIADIFLNWSKFKICSFLKNDEEGNPCIAVGRSYFTGSVKESILAGAPKYIPVIQFDYHIADDGLTLMSTDKNFLAVEAQMMSKNGRFYKITVRLNPEYDESAKSGDKSKKWSILNETTISKKAQRLGAISQTGTRTKVDLSSYTVIPYMSRKIVDDINNNSAKENLIKEAQSYFESYSMTGIEGTLTLFGDLALRTGTKVELLDIHQPAKNGYYLTEEVVTKFGVNGYRQTIKLPYRIKKDNNAYGRKNTK